MTEETITIGGIEVTDPNETFDRLSILLWGPSGCGKTTLASTAPGRKLFITFDPDGDKSLKGIPDCKVLDLSDRPASITQRFMQDDPLRISQEFDNFDTIVFDSATFYTALSLKAATEEVKSVTMEAPAQLGYGFRNTRTMTALNNLNRLTKKHKKHFIIITHEGSPVTDKDGTVLSISMLLGGKMANNLSAAMSEVWYMEDRNGKRFISVRPVRLRSPMKTRMFNATQQDCTFEWKADTGISDWHKDWCEKGAKIDLPS